MHVLLYAAQSDQEGFQTLDLQAYQLSAAVQVTILYRHMHTTVNGVAPGPPNTNTKYDCVKGLIVYVYKLRTVSIFECTCM